MQTGDVASSWAAWKAAEASSAVGRRGNNVHNQSSLLEEITTPSDKETGHCGGETDVRQDVEWLQ